MPVYLVEQCQRRQVCEKLSPPLQPSYTNPREPYLPPAIPQEMPKGLTNSSCNICWMQNYRALVNQQRNELKRKNRYEEHPPCSTLPTEPKGWEGLRFSDAMPAPRTASAAPCVLPVKTFPSFITELLQQFITRCCSFCLLIAMY